MLLSILCLVAQSALPVLNEPFNLAVGESVAIEGTELALTFTAVTRDSRCPRDVNCIVAGEAIVDFEAHLGTRVTELTLKVPPGGEDEQELDEFTIAIVNLEPETDSTKKIESDDYVATVVVRQR